METACCLYPLSTSLSHAMSCVRLPFYHMLARRSPSLSSSASTASSRCTPMSCCHALRLFCPACLLRRVLSRGSNGMRRTKKASPLGATTARSFRLLKACLLVAREDTLSSVLM